MSFLTSCPMTKDVASQELRNITRGVPKPRSMIAQRPPPPPKQNSRQYQQKPLEKQKLTPAPSLRSAPPRPSPKHTANDCPWKPSSDSNSPHTPSNFFFFEREFFHTERISSLFQDVFWKDKVNSSLNMAVYNKFSC